MVKWIQRQQKSNHEDQRAVAQEPQNLQNPEVAVKMEQSQNLIQELVWKMTIHIYNLLLHQDLPPIQGNIIMKLARIT